MSTELLVVEDDDAIGRQFTESLPARGWRAFHAATARAALDRLAVVAGSTWCCSTWVCRTWTASRCAGSCARPSPTR